MSIPERLFRLAKGKAGELREYFDHLGENDELSLEEEAKLIRSQQKKTARKELDEAIDSPFTSTLVSPSQVDRSRPAARPRTPEEISGVSSVSAVASGNAATSNQIADPLAPHYRLLGLELGSDYPTVQSVYEKLEERCRPDRFTAGSPEAKELEDIRTKLETAFHALRAALDPTARRFDLLEIE